MKEAETKTLERVLEGFAFEGKPVRCVPWGSGHICLTYRVDCEGGRSYILQRMNEQLTRDIPGLMNNIALVTAHLRKKAEDPRSVLCLVPARDGNWYWKEEGFWRAYAFIQDSFCLESPRTEEDFYQSALAFGRFGEDLKDFPAERLLEVIPDFHNTPVRYRNFRRSLERDVRNRRAEVKNETEFILEREEEMGILQRLREAGELPVRVTHNDTKLNNVLFDQKTGKALCVIDLDTVMPGLALYDYGDSIRFGASTAAEDERDLSKVELDLRKFRVYTRGFLSACRDLTDREVELLPLGAKTMTLECGMRFLGDYLDGDVYYAIRYPGQNLDRCRTQLRLVADMEKKWEEMRKIVKEEADVQ